MGYVLAGSTAIIMMIVTHIVAVLVGIPIGMAIWALVVGLLAEITMLDNHDGSQS